MIVEYCMESNGEKYEFKSVGKLDKNTLIFKDNMLKNNTITITFLNDYVKIERDGKVNMKMEFKVGKKLEGFYENDMGYYMKTYSLTHKIKIDKNLIFVQYDSYFGEEFNSLTQIMVKF